MTKSNFLGFLLSTCVVVFMCACGEKEGPSGKGPQNTTQNGNQPSTGTTRNRLKVISFNVRYPASEDTGDKSWSRRLPAVVAMLKEKNPDVLGVQECYYSQRADILKNFPTWKYYGVSRSSGKDENTTAETTSILYNAERFKAVESGTFWLSETPDIPSAGWGATIKRSTTWILFEEIETGNRFYHFNTHLDHASAQAREEGAKLIRRRIASMNWSTNYPVVLTGDMNVEQNTNVCGFFEMNNARTSTRNTDDSITCHGYGSKTQQIDHIFYEGFSIVSFRTVLGEWNGLKYISDHSPVQAIFDL